jgi:hypothetical protein
MAEGNYNLAQRVRDLLNGNGIPFVGEPVRGAFRPDFLLNRKDGSTLVLEAKGWELDPINRERASYETQILKREANVTDAWIVVSGWRSEPDQGIYDVDDLLEAIRRWTGVSELVQPQPSTDNPPRIFAVLPFARRFNDTYWVGMIGACKQVHAECDRVDEVRYEGEVPDKIRALIDACRVVIADLTDARPNVMYEMGYADGRGKPVIPIIAGDTKDLPFDVQSRNVLTYEFGNTHELVTMLVPRLAALLH